MRASPKLHADACVLVLGKRDLISAFIVIIIIIR